MRTKGERISKFIPIWLIVPGKRSPRPRRYRARGLLKSCTSCASCDAKSAIMQQREIFVAFASHVRERNLRSVESSLESRKRQREREKRQQQPVLLKLKKQFICPVRVRVWVWVLEPPEWGLNLCAEILGTAFAQRMREVSVITTRQLPCRIINGYTAFELLLSLCENWLQNGAVCRTVQLPCMFIKCLVMNRAYEIRSVALILHLHTATSSLSSLLSAKSCLTLHKMCHESLRNAPKVNDSIQSIPFLLSLSLSLSFQYFLSVLINVFEAYWANIWHCCKVSISFNCR